MDTLIKQWLGEKKIKDTAWLEKNYYINETIDSLTADLPSLLEKIKDGLLKEVGEDEEYIEKTGDGITDIFTKAIVEDTNKERTRTRQIITKFLSINK